MGPCMVTSLWQDFYRKEKRAVSRPECMYESFDHCAEHIGKRILDYQKKAEEYQKSCVLGECNLAGDQQREPWSRAGREPGLDLIPPSLGGSRRTQRNRPVKSQPLGVKRKQWLNLTGLKKKKVKICCLFRNQLVSHFDSQSLSFYLLMKWYIECFLVNFQSCITVTTVRVSPHQPSPPRPKQPTSTVSL